MKKRRVNRESRGPELWRREGPPVAIRTTGMCSPRFSFSSLSPPQRLTQAGLMLRRLSSFSFRDSGAPGCVCVALPNTAGRLPLYICILVKEPWLSSPDTRDHAVWSKRWDRNRHRDASLIHSESFHMQSLPITSSFGLQSLALPLVFWRLFPAAPVASGGFRGPGGAAPGRGAIPMTAPVPFGGHRLQPRFLSL